MYGADSVRFGHGGLRILAGPLCVGMFGQQGALALCH